MCVSECVYVYESEQEGKENKMRESSVRGLKGRVGEGMEKPALGND